MKTQEERVAEFNELVRPIMKWMQRTYIHIQRL